MLAINVEMNKAIGLEHEAYTHLAHQIYCHVGQSPRPPTPNPAPLPPPPPHLSSAVLLHQMTSSRILGTATICVVLSHAVSKFTNQGRESGSRTSCARTSRH